eukprot:1153492-Pelagomonas_calceolata.AAC.1
MSPECIPRNCILCLLIVDECCMQSWRYIWALDLSSMLDHLPENNSIQPTQGATNCEHAIIPWIQNRALLGGLTSLPAYRGEAGGPHDKEEFVDALLGFRGKHPETLSTTPSGPGDSLLLIVLMYSLKALLSMMEWSHSL